MPSPQRSADVQIATPAPVMVSQEATIRLQALLDQQVSTMRALVGAEAKLAAAEREFARTTGTEQLRTKEVVLEAGQQVERYRAALADLHVQIAELQNHAVPVPMEVPRDFSYAQHEERILGYTKPEFIGVASLMILFPLVIAFAVRIVRRGRVPVVSTLEADRFSRLEQAVESIAIEVERIGESQRFTSKVLSDRAAPSAAPRFKPSITPV